ncbi:efflux RND transporter permease subunit [Aestuariibacter halophilus]|uniref:Efflux RND transporter permease subunit n=1 Tax=Fluctibacter halophilus TaxID=226011 RepID=A0ABS8G937_9ALTE|nr:efflux RND transporter permease subunit [Aestuariibacter halophilus]MCC2617060.1 efflux RND transporter permease subunit [Aestuariibacter halophilus]
MIRFFALHPTAANLLMIAIVFLGLSEISALKRETFPEFSAQKVGITVLYPGALPQDAESALCLPIEDALDDVDQIDEVQCDARQDMAIATVTLQEGGDISRLMADTKNAIDGITEFPHDAEKPVVEELGRNDPVIHLAITAQRSPSALYSYARTVKDALERDTNVSQVRLEGFSDHQLVVNVSLRKLRQYGLSMRQLQARLADQNVLLPSGKLESHQQTLLLRFDQQAVTPQHLAQLPIGSSADGGTVTLGDIATVTDTFEQEDIFTTIDGQRAALLIIEKSKHQDALTLVDEVRDFVTRLSATAPDDVTFTLTNDTSTIIAERLSMLVENGIQGFVLVFAVMWLFFAWRYAFWVSMGLPVAFLGAFFCMSMLGVSINMISMVAMLMAIGILMDDAIVIAENIAAEIDRGGRLEDAVVSGVRAVFPGVLSSYLTTCAVFAGLAFIAGDIGQVLKDIPIVLLLTLSVSLIEAFFILPHHLLHAMQNDKQTQRPQAAFKTRFIQRFDAFRQHRLLAITESVVRYRYAFVGAVIASLFVALTLVSVGWVKFKAFPATEGDILEARLIMPPGTSHGLTQQAVDRIVEGAKRLNEWADSSAQSSSLIQHLTVEYGKNPDAFDSGAHLALVRLDLLGVGERQQALAEIKQQWQQQVGEIPGAVVLTFTEPTFGPAGRAIEIRLQATDMRMLQNVSEQLLSKIVTYDGVHNVLADTRLGPEQLSLALKPGLLALGVDGSQIAQQLRGAFNGYKIDDLQHNDEQLELYIQLQASDRMNLEQLNNYPITLNDGTQIPLSALADFNYQRGPSRINRIDGQRTITVIGDVDSERGNTQEILAHLLSGTLAEQQSTYPDLRIEFEGESKEGQTTARSIGGTFLLGLVGIFIILSFQFKSYLEPVIVMLAIPMALIGVIIGHALLGFDLTMPSMIGFVSLAGIVVNDSILLVTFIKNHMQRGLDAHIAAVHASRDRFRAVFITSATTIAGTFPLLLETSTQAQVLQPLVVSLIFGIAASTFLVLLVIPCLYVIMQDLGLASDHHLRDSPD